MNPHLGLSTITSSKMLTETQPRSTGKERDSETGLDYFGARYYGSNMGRFMSADEVFADQHPQDPQSWNLYSYVRNNPLAMVDRTGRDALWITNKQTGQTRLVIPVHFTGPGAREKIVAAIVERVKALNTNGSPVKIEVVSTDKPINGVLNKMDLSPGLDHKMCGDPGECVNKVGGNKGHIDSSQIDYDEAAAHDTLHFAGLEDRYTEGKRDENGQRTSIPDPGYDNSNFMTSRSGTDLKPEQVQEANKNKSTKHCTEDNGKTKCN